MPTGSPPRKLDTLLALMRAERWTEALAYAAKFPDLGEWDAAIRRGHQAGWAPDFYRQIGRDPAAMVQAGITALRARYGHHLL